MCIPLFSGCTCTNKIKNVFLGSTFFGPFYWIYDVRDSYIQKKKLTKIDVNRRMFIVYIIIIRLYYFTNIVWFISLTERRFLCLYKLFPVLYCQDMYIMVIIWLRQKTVKYLYQADTSFPNYFSFLCYQCSFIIHLLAFIKSHDIQISNSLCFQLKKKENKYLSYIQNNS